MEPTVRAAVDAWLADSAISEPDKAEVRELLACGEETALADRFYRDLEFGTGGLRGVMGAGLNRMNVSTVGAAAQGLANYLLKHSEAGAASCAIAYDCRHNSRRFAERVASVMAASGVVAHLFDDLRPTPELSFAIRRLRCTAGVVITASHNPPAYNGLKAYWEDGGQVTPPHDEGIIAEVRGVGSFSNVKTLEPAEARRRGLIRGLGREMDEAFLEAAQGSCLNADACRAQGERLAIVYTGLHGTGSTLIPEALRRRGFRRVLEVAEQAEPDGDFPTVTSPNPEEGAALEMAIDLARREGADLVIGTDPDADRVGIAVKRPTGDYTLLSGNQTAALLTHYICEQLTRLGRFPEHAVVLSTIVSGDLMKEIARAYGAEVEETLTGFKWIGRRITEFEAAGPPGAPRKTYVFGAEESYGYMPCSFVRDKDAVTSAAFIAEMAASAASAGKTLLTVLEELYRRFGYFEEGAKSVTMPGREGAERISRLMDQLRREPPEAFGGQPVIAIADLLTGLRRDPRTGARIGQFELPSSDVLMFTLADETKVVARPSGTEPKIKFYVLMRQPGDDLPRARTTAALKLRAIGEDLASLSVVR